MTEQIAPKPSEWHVFVAKNIAGAWDGDYGIAVLCTPGEAELKKYTRYRSGNPRVYSEWTMAFPDQQPPQLYVHVHYEGDGATPGARASINTLVQSATFLGLVEVSL